MQITYGLDTAQYKRRRAAACFVILAGVALALAAVLWSASYRGSDFSTQLPGGYLLVRTNADAIEIFNTTSSKIEVSGKVQELAIIPQAQLIVGRATSDPAHDQRLNGYFIVDTALGSSVTNLTEADWREKLTRQYRVSVPPLVEPRKIRSQSKW
jgi:hypothetical protein